MNEKFDLLNSSSDEQKSLESSGYLETPDSLLDTPSEYVSPYELKQCPLDYIIIHNRSKNAANYAVEKLKLAWPDLKIIHVVQGDRSPIPGADYEVHIDDWSSMAHFNQRLNEWMSKQKVDLSRSMQEKKVGFYCVWSAAAENADWAEEAQRFGFKWIGASPDKMRGLDKIEYKKLCQANGLPTADFIEIKAPADILKKEDALKVMSHNLLDLYSKTPALAGKSIFVKHNQGGGGRGSKKVDVAQLNPENVYKALDKIVSETGGDLNGVYAEIALDLEDAQLLQIELECDASELAFGGRMVWFNKEMQKVLEVGFTDEAILEILPKDVYEQCQAASRAVFAASGYDSRGTNEILLVKHKAGNWRFYSSELNKRIQVENEALSELVVDKTGHSRNTAAEQVMRACGFPAPKAFDFRVKGPAIVGHVRLLSCQITPEGSRYPKDLVIDDALYLPDTNVRYAKGPVHLDADPQIGRALLTANNWMDFCNKLLNFTQSFQFAGPNTNSSTYLSFFRKLASNPTFKAGLLGCNQTFDVLSDAPVEPGPVQKIVATLANSVTPLVIRGYRPGEGVQDQPYPNAEQIQRYKEFTTALPPAHAPQQTPFAAYIEHKDFERYIVEFKQYLKSHGGGSIGVIRDVQQSQADQESALIQRITAKIAELYFANSGMGVGFETGGAQYQAALMRGIDWWDVLLAGCLPNLPSHSLTRSGWMNGLTLKSQAIQAFVFRTISKEVAAHYHFPADGLPFIPWMPYNFHAGNHPKQDITTREMLRANLAVIPNWAWEPRYSEEDFRGWVLRQINLFREEAKPFHQIRIKNPGQGRHWTSDAIVNMVDIIRQEFARAGLEEPIIFIHNHEFDGKAAGIGAVAIKQCQERGYPYLIVDSAPPETSHNSNLVIASALTTTAEENANLALYNEGNRLALDLTIRFNNQLQTSKYLDPNSEMAGGTISSDYASAIQLGIPPAEISQAIALAKEVIGLGTPVTPYSEWIKQIGFAIWTNKDIILNKKLTDDSDLNQKILLENIQSVTQYIQQKGQLRIATPILVGLQAWETLLKRPPIVEQLLANHGMSPFPAEEKVDEPLDIEVERSKLQSQLPSTKVSDRDLCTYLAFGQIGLDFLKRRDGVMPTQGPRDLTSLMSSPEFVHSQHKTVGDSFLLEGEVITINKIETHPGKGTIDVEYAFQGHLIRTTVADPNQFAAAAKATRLVTDPRVEIGAPMPGQLIGFFVRPGDRVVKGQLLAKENVMKMEHSIFANQDGEVAYVNPALEGEIVDADEVLVAFR